MTWNDPDDHGSNPTVDDRTTFNEIARRAITRRTVLRGGAATAAMTIFAGTGLATAKPGGTGRGDAPGQQEKRARGGLLGFEPITTGTTPTMGGILLAEGYSAQFLAPWGDPVDGVGPAWVDGGGNTADEQALQLGMGHDGMEFFPINGSSTHGLLAINHEYTVRHQLFPVEFYDDPSTADAEVADHTPETVRKEQNAHGVAVIEVQQVDDGWIVVDGGLGRRITPNTEMAISGPAASHPLLAWGGRDGTTTTGTVNNCSSGQTPWGTYVTCEENFHGYFWLGDEGEVSAEQQELFDRYGFSAFGFGYPWGGVDEDWRADLNPGRTNTYGWNVEIDPFDPDSTPVKRTAMGRVKHEGATFTTGRGNRVVCYMGDDQRFDYLYKYVSAGNYRSMLARGQSPLDDGTLYVARFEEDGTGEWLALDHDSQPALQADDRFADQAEVLIKTRLAADVLGATPCDRPEWTAVHPDTGEVFATFTNNSRRTEADPANPLVPNPDGHIISIRERQGDNAATTFTWDFFVMGYDEDSIAYAEENGLDLPFVGEGAAFSDPDGLGFDQDGRLWIQTDGGQPFGMNDVMLGADPATREIRRFFMGPLNCEVTGLTFTPDGRTCFINIQHPNDEVAPDNTDPSVYPEPFGDVRPRPSTVVITKDDSGVIGT